MSRVGKKPILIPQGVEVKIEDEIIKISGPKGELSQKIQPEIKVGLKQGKVSLECLESETKKGKAIWGLSRALINNMIEGVTAGFEKKLEIEGLGFKGQLSDDNLSLYVGFSHPVEIKAPPGIKFSLAKNIITVSGIDKQKVSQTAAVIRKIKPPEPYKGKGIRYAGEKIRKKVGKKAVAVGAK
jgi:large subunit ribosomal protein L6